MRLPAYLLVLLTLTGSWSCHSPTRPEFLLRASLLVAEDHTWFRAFQHFGELLDERSGGRIHLQTYPSEQLAKEIEAIRMIQAGVIDMTTTSALLSNWTEIMTFCEMPFLMDSMEEVDAMLTGPVGARIRDEMVTKTGLRPVGYFQAGPRHLTSNRPVRHPDDLQGLVIRIPSVPAFVTAWDALGAKTTPIAFSEVFTSLQQGVINAQENPLPLTKMLALYEVQEYVNLTSHVFGWTYPVIGEKQFDRMPADLQEIFLDCAREMQAFERQLFLDNDNKTRLALEASGMTFVEVDREAFKQKHGNAIYRTLSPEMQAVYRSLKDTVQ
ncbi:tripartite ATP-independent transporter DctP family solute receptor [Lewinella aquimaris]|uniref:Tripartite ATP-independent transporter DctP family solute receptor n=1 Tax=Neolewinella aquimaris TaxID=1835722 RepID=A0A840E1X7_9BACT|nr:TRAP transporter substrate-binding protein [Neolewinella aquimaris]MBB4077963.1 tripartite ATP-independent transporter DctP family solute receptor [Neolewinella aquimaris]